MKEKGWDLGQDEEELLEYALHPEQYEAFKSGKAKEDFLKDLELKRSKKKDIMTGNAQPSEVIVEVDGMEYLARIKYPDTSKKSVSAEKNVIKSPLEGKFYLTRNQGDKGIAIGDIIKEGDTIGYVESMKVMNAISADKSGKITAIEAKHGEQIFEDDVIIELG
jgi:pyruvate carboxylase subunit B